MKTPINKEQENECNEQLQETSECRTALKTQKQEVKERQERVVDGHRTMN